MRSSDRNQHLSWQSKKFLFRPSSWVLSTVVVLCAFSICLAFVSTFYIETNLTVSVEGEIQDSLGTREVFSKTKGLIFQVTKGHGESVKENEILATIAIGSLNYSQLISLIQEYKDFYSELAIGPEANLSKFPNPQIEKLDNLEASNLYIKVKQSYDSFVFQKTQKVSQMSSQVKPLEMRVKELKNKINFIRKSKYQSQLKFQVETINSDISKLEIDISLETNRIHSRYLEAYYDLVATTKTFSNFLENISSRHRVVSPVKGTVAKVMAEPNTNISENSVLFLVSPDNSSQQVRTLVPSKSIGKIKVGQPLLFKVDAYPYQKYGVFEGKVLTVNRIAESIKGEKFYEVRASISLPAQSRSIASEIVLVPGMPLEAQIILIRKPIFNQISDYILSRSSE